MRAAPWSTTAIAIAIAVGLAPASGRAAPTPASGEDPDLLETPPSHAEPQSTPSSQDQPPELSPVILPALHPGDRVKSVQRRPFLKAHRVELTPFAFAGLNNAYFPRQGVGARLTYHLSETFAAAATWRTIDSYQTDNVRLAKRTLQARLGSSDPRSELSGSLYWTPIYGKVALFDSIHHFDLYLAGGFGAIQSGSASGDTTHPSTHLGLGQRFSITDFLMVDLALIETLWSDAPDGGAKTQLQHDLSIQLGVGLFFPFTFRHREP